MISVEILATIAFAIGVVIGWVGQDYQRELDRLNWAEEREELAKRIRDLGG